MRFQFPLLYTIVSYGTRAEDAVRQQSEEGGDDVLLLQVAKQKLIKKDDFIKEGGKDDEPNIGHVDCRCLTESETDLVEGGYFPLAEYIREVDGEKYNDLPHCAHPFDRDRDWLLPYELGLGQCGAYFRDQAPFCGEGTESSPRTWTDDWMCNMPFCIVNPFQCPDSWVIPGNLFPGMAFSYLTCATDLTSEAEGAQMKAATEMLKHDHRAYHCAGGQVDEALQEHADQIEEMGSESPSTAQVDAEEAGSENLDNKGHSNCRCLTESETDLVEGGYFPLAEYIREDDDGNKYNDLPNCAHPFDRDEDWLLPYELGLEQCGAYFRDQAPFCGEGTESSPRTWTDDWMCNMPFCLVNPFECPDAWVIPGNLFPGMAFSYLTCATAETTDAQRAQMEAATELLKHDHRAYHCAGGQVDEALQEHADSVEEMS